MERIHSEASILKNYFGCLNANYLFLWLCIICAALHVPLPIQCTYTNIHPSFWNVNQLSPNVNETFHAYGIFAVSKYENFNPTKKNFCATARWFQDDEVEKLRLDIGLPGELGFTTMIFFGALGSVQIVPHQSATDTEPHLECIRHNITYQEEVNNHSGKNFHYIGTITSFLNMPSEFDRKGVINLYAGTIGEEASSPKAVLYEFDFLNGTRLYAGMDTLSAPNSVGIMRYWYYDHVLGKPDDEIFEWRKYCDKSVPEAAKLVQAELGSASGARYCNTACENGDETKMETYAEQEH